MSMFVGTHLFGVVGLFGLPILLSLLRYLNDNGTISLFPASALGKSEPGRGQAQRGIQASGQAGHSVPPASAVRAATRPAHFAKGALL